jgi:hypothetical protein
MRISYIGGTPGADSNAYTVVDTTQMGGGGVLSNGGANTVVVNIKNDQTGTLKEYRSADKGSTWTQISQTSVAIPAAGQSNSYEFSVLQFTDWKLEWVNGGTAQTVWAVDIGTIKKPRSGSPTPNDLKLDGTHRDVVQWCLCPWALSGHGAVPLDEASVDPDCTGYPITNVGRTTGIDDPDSGNNAVRLLESSGAGSTYHRTRTPTVADAGTWSDIDFWVRAAGCDWFVAGASGVGFYGYGRFSTGETSGLAAGATLSIIEGSAGSGWQKWRLGIRSVGSQPNLYFYTADSTPQTTYDAGAGGNGFDLYLPTMTQPRASAWADESLLDNGTKRGADPANADPATQSLFYERFKTINNLAALFGEDGRSSNLETNHADPVGAGSGDDPPCAVMGVASCESGGQLFRWDGAGGEYQYLFRDGAELKLTRHDGASPDTQTFGSGLGSLLDSPQMIHLFGLGGRQWALCIGGVYRDTVTMADLASATMTSFRPFNATGTGGVVMAEYALFGDLSSLSTWSAILAKLQNSAGGLAMQLRWNV